MPFDKKYSETVFSKTVRAGKRTYYFDVKVTKSRQDFFLFITERKVNAEDVQRHRLYLYKEDFDKFRDALDEAVDFAQAKIAAAKK